MRALHIQRLQMQLESGGQEDECPFPPIAPIVLVCEQHSANCAAERLAPDSDGLLRSSRTK